MRIPIVNEKDEVIEYKDINNRDNKDIIRVSGLWIVDRDGNTLLAQRSFNKKHGPGQWGPAVAGTVEEGETYESNIIKEAEEEIGLKDIKPILGPKYRRSTTHEYFSQWFILEISKDTHLEVQKEEVENVKWFSKVELEKLVEEKPEMFLQNFKQYMEIYK